MKLIPNILIAGLIAGTMDILGAIFFLAGGNAVRVLKYVASGFFGKAALEGGGEMAIYGLIFHYIIALGWTTLYFLIYPKLHFLRRNKWLNAVIYGAFVWTIMNLIIVPLSQIGFRGFGLMNVVENVVILIICIGLPVSLMADRFYRSTENTD